MTAASFDEIPVYLRLRGMLAIEIIEGKYREGDQLPSVRAFVVKRGVGMFVAPGAVEALKVQEREIFLNRIWPRMRALIDRLDIDIAELTAQETA
jgi:GntR family transcriptional regulator